MYYYFICLFHWFFNVSYLNILQHITKYICLIHFVEIIYEALYICSTAYPVGYYFKLTV